MRDSFLDKCHLVSVQGLSWRSFETLRDKISPIPSITLPGKDHSSNSPWGHWRDRMGDGSGPLADSGPHLSENTHAFFHWMRASPVTDCQLQESLPRAGKPSELDILALTELVRGQYQQ